MELSIELLTGIETCMGRALPLPKPVFLVVSVKMSKRYLKGGLQSSFSFIFGFSISPVKS